VAERTVTDVVQKERGADETPLVCRVGCVRKQAGRMAGQLVVGARAHRERSQRVAEARMLGGRKRKVCEPKLSQPAQSLHRRHVEQFRFRCG